MAKIGIIGAMEIEVETLKAKMTTKRTLSRARMEFFEGTIGDAQIVVVRSGVGKVNAGVCVQILADEFGVTHIINTGAAGSLNDSVDIGDMVVSTDVCYHDVDATIWGYAPGEVPQLGVASFAADDKMIDATLDAIKTVFEGQCKGFKGRILSGDQFIASKDVKKRLIETFDGMCAEMEGAAIAHASFLNNIPFVIIRAISDKADIFDQVDPSAQMDYPEFEKMAAARSAKLVEYLITVL